jgi:hypothetical protein
MHILKDGFFMSIVLEFAGFFSRHHTNDRSCNNFAFPPFQSPHTLLITLRFTAYFQSPCISTSLYCACVELRKREFRYNTWPCMHACVDKVSIKLSLSVSQMPIKQQKGLQLVLAVRAGWPSTTMLFRGQKVHSITKKFTWPVENPRKASSGRRCFYHTATPTKSFDTSSTYLLWGKTLCANLYSRFRAIVLLPNFEYWLWSYLHFVRQCIFTATFLKMKLQFTPTPWTVCNSVKNVDNRHICPCECAPTFIRILWFLPLFYDFYHMYLDTIQHILSGTCK